MMLMRRDVLEGYVNDADMHLGSTGDPDELLLVTLNRSRMALAVGWHYAPYPRIRWWTRLIWRLGGIKKPDATS